MNKILEILLPANADNTIRGSKLPFLFFILIAVIGSCGLHPHLLAGWRGRHHAG